MNGLTAPSGGGRLGARFRRVLGSTLALALLACAPRRDPLAVEYAGCAEVDRDGPTCRFAIPAGKSTATLTLWVPDSEGQPSDAEPSETRIAVNGEGFAVEGKAVLGGVRYSINLRSNAREVVVSRRDLVWRLPVAQRSPTPDWLAAAVELGNGNSDDRHRARALIQERFPTLVPDLHARALSRLARIPSDSQAPEMQRREFSLAIAAHRRARHLYGEAWDAATLAAHLLEDYLLAEATQVLSAVHLPDNTPAEARYHLDFESAVVAFQGGNLRGALRNLKGATVLAERLGLEGLLDAAEQQRALILQDLGRFAEADALLGRLFARDPERGGNPCEAASLHANRGWGRLLAREAEIPLADPLPDLEAAQSRLSSARGCPEERALNAAINLTLAHLQRSNLIAAAHSLERARRLSPGATGDRRLWLRELEGRLALAQGQPTRALTQFRDLAADATSAGSLEALWRARYGQALTLATTPRWQDAQLPLDESEDILDRQALFVPRPGRARFATQRDAGARLRIALLLRAERTADALAAARRSLARVLRQLEVESRIERLDGEGQRRWQEAIGRYLDSRRRCERETGTEWQLPRDSLEAERRERAHRCAVAEDEFEETAAVLGLGTASAPPDVFASPAIGEVQLTFHRLPEGWAAFASDADGVEAHTVSIAGDTSPRALAERLLAPFSTKIRAARWVRVLAPREIRKLNLPAANFEGAPLLANRDVAYGVDLDPRSSRNADPADTSKRALVVADPRGDLPLARREADGVARDLARGGWRVDRLDGEAATVEATLGAITHADLFHYSGHGVSGDADGGGEVRLAHQGRLSASEISTLPRVPRFVVLSGCETSIGDRGSALDGLGVAQAFLLRGALAVVAADEPVPEEEAAELFADFYALSTSASAGSLDLARLLRRAQLRALARQDRAALHFKVYVR